MFDEAHDELADALANEGTALTTSEAKSAIDLGSLATEQALDEHAVVEESDGEEYVVSLEDLDRTYPLPDQGGEQDASEASEDGEKDDATTTEAQATQDFSATQQRNPEALTGERSDTYNVAGLTIDVNPARLLAGEPTGTDVFGARKLTNDHPAVPETQVPYYPVELADRDTEDVFYRALGRHKPVILEGEAGTGKNQLVASAASSLNLPMYRQEFGADTSVMDVVGEKDLSGDGGTHYILGMAAKAAMFGGIYVADEINMATGSVTSYLHPLFEEKGARELELRGTGRTLRDLPQGVEWDPEKHLGEYIHPDFHAVGTCNPLHYADTSEMNDALRSRCIVIEHPYLAESEGDVDGIEREAELLSDETGVDVQNAKPLVRLAAVLREARRESNTPTCPIGHRELRDTVELAGPEEQFMSFKSAAQIKMVGQASLKQDKQYVRDTIAEEL
jgi:nitric oxide reductase NorQ protein